MGFATAAGLALSAAGTVQQYRQGKKQEKAQKNAQRIQQQSIERENEIRQREADRQTQRARVKAIREARIRRGALSAYAGSTGTLGSSGALGAAGSISSQLTSGLASGAAERDSARELGDLNVATGAALSRENINIASAKSSMNTWGAIGGFGSSIFDAGGGFKTIFSKPTSTSTSLPDYGGGAGDYRGR
jgi:hypothetical protein